MSESSSTPSSIPSQPLTARLIALVLLTGAVAGFLSGLFGVGGGLVIVPALMAIVKMDQRRASATSLAAIVVTASVGTASYATIGNVSWVAGVFLMMGSLVGSQVGVWLLRRLPARILPWLFVSFALIVALSQQLRVPTRDTEVVFTPLTCALIILVGLIAGILSGLVGVGGGTVIVPGMELVVGAGDLLARGTSLLVMIPTGIAGTITNMRHSLVDIRTGLLVGLAAACSAPAGQVVASLVSPAVGNWLFTIFLLAVIASIVRKELTRSSRTH